jgi:hypothetical protein
MNNLIRPTITRTREKEKPPLILGPERLHYQYSVTLPTMHFTLVSVLQSLSLGVLITNIPLPGDASCPLTKEVSIGHVFDCLSNSYLYLPEAICLMLVLLIWMQFVSTAMFLIWPLSTFQSALVFLLAVAEILCFREISNFSFWLISLGMIGFIGGVIRLNNLRIQKREEVEQWEIATYKAQNERRDGTLYCGLGLTFLILGAAYPLIEQILFRNNQMWEHISSWGIVVSLTVLVSGILLEDARRRKSFLRQLVKGTDLDFTNDGVMGYKK